MTHVVMGYPSLEQSKDRVLRMVEAGVDMIELQIPFSDPLADGPAITAANQQALANGTTVDQCFAMIAELRSLVTIPLILIGYYNTVHHYGIEVFLDKAKAVGVNALTFPDMPVTEEPYENFYAYAKNHQLPVIQLVSPASTPERLQAIAENAEYYIYCVARFGVTGTGTQHLELADYLKRVRQYSPLPLAVGFGISTPEQVASLRGLADIVVVGSALLPYDGPKLTEQLQRLCQSK